MSEETAESQRSMVASVVDTLARVPSPLMVLRVNGHIEYANAAALRLSELPGLIQLKKGQITALAGDPRPIACALAQVAKGVGCVLPFTLVFSNTARPGLMRLASLRDDPIYEAAWPLAVAMAAIELRSEIDEHAALALLASRYEITPAELKVLRRLADGQSLRAIADEMHVKVSTVRTHIRSLFNKTGLRRQAHLTRLVPHTPPPPPTRPLHSAVM